MFKRYKEFSQKFWLKHPKLKKLHNFTVLLALLRSKAKSAASAANKYAGVVIPITIASALGAGYASYSAGERNGYADCVNKELSSITTTTPTTIPVTVVTTQLVTEPPTVTFTTVPINSVTVVTNTSKTFISNYKGSSLSEGERIDTPSESYVPSVLTVRSGAHVESMKFKGLLSHGETQAPKVDITLKSGEFFKAINGVFASTGILHHVGIVTNKSSYGPFGVGVTGGKPFSLVAPDGHEIVGLVSKPETSINALAIITRVKKLGVVPVPSTSTVPTSVVGPLPAGSNPGGFTLAVSNGELVGFGLRGRDGTDGGVLGGTLTGQIVDVILESSEHVVSINMSADGKSVTVITYGSTGVKLYGPYGKVINTVSTVRPPSTISPTTNGTTTIPQTSTGFPNTTITTTTTVVPTLTIPLTVPPAVCL